MGIRQWVAEVLGPPQLDEVRVVCQVISAQPGTMVDVGAHHGHALDPYLRRGWTVHAFEPDPHNRAVLESRCSGITIDPRAVAENDGDEVALFTSDVSTGISTLSPFHGSHTATATVQTVRLDTYLRENSVTRVDFLKTDVEGYDLFALRTFPWATHHPRAVVCEFEDHKTVKLGHATDDIAQFLQQQGYAVLVSEWWPIVEYGTAHRWRRFVRYPCVVPDDSWGNLIAVDPHLLDAVERAGRSAVKRVRVRKLVDRIRTHG